MKKNTSMWIDREVLKAMRMIGVARDLPNGDVIAALIEFSEMGSVIDDPIFTKRFNLLLDDAFANAGIQEGALVDETAADQLAEELGEPVGNRVEDIDDPTGE